MDQYWDKDVPSIPAVKHKIPRFLIFVLILLPVISFFFSSIYPVWIAPPHTYYTFYFYLGLVFIWLTLFLYTALRAYPDIKSRGVLFTLLLLFFAPCILCFVSARNIPIPGIFVTFSCTEEALTDGRIQYICTRQAVEERTVYTLEGRDGWPFAHLVDQEFHR